MRKITIAVAILVLITLGLSFWIFQDGTVQRPSAESRVEMTDELKASGWARAEDMVEFPMYRDKSFGSYSVMLITGNHLKEHFEHFKLQGINLVNIPATINSRVGQLIADTQNHLGMVPNDNGWLTSIDQVGSMCLIVPSSDSEALVFYIY